MTKIRPQDENEIITFSKEIIEKVTSITQNQNYALDKLTEKINGILYELKSTLTTKDNIKEEQSVIISKIEISTKNISEEIEKFRDKLISDTGVLTKFQDQLIGSNGSIEKLRKDLIGQPDGSITKLQKDVKEFSEEMIGKHGVITKINNLYKNLRFALPILLLLISLIFLGIKVVTDKQLLDSIVKSRNAIEQVQHSGGDKHSDKSKHDNK